MTGTALVSYQERFEQDADELAQREARGGVALSTKGGVFALAGQILGPSIVVVVIDSYYEFNFFNPTFAYEPTNPLPPMCYSFGRDKKALVPHADMQQDPTWFWPQNAQCEGCALNRWGSSPRGKGKACQNRERLFLIPAGFFQPPARGVRGQPELHLHQAPDHYAKADIVSLRLPVTSVENWSRYVTSIASAQRRPPYAVFTEIAIRADPKTSFRLHFDFLEPCPDDLFDVILQRVDSQLQQPFIGYTPPTDEQRQKAAAPPPQAQTAGTWGEAGFGRR